jgi:hypothetical protein
MKKHVWRVWFAAVALSGCGGSGNLSLTVWGEEFIEQQIPTDTFEDGYSVRFSKFLVVIKDFTLATKTGTTGPSQSTPYVVDVTKPGPIELQTFTGLNAIKWDAVSYGIGPSPSAVGRGTVTAADVEAMTTGGHSVWVDGTVSKGTMSKTFSWKFDTDTHYASCTNPDLGEGVTVASGGNEVVELTIHGDHLWYDDLQSPEAKVRGQAVVTADADADGTVTQAELTQVQLTALPLGQYGTGGANNVKNLNDFVRSLVRTIGHYRGEGECEAMSR